MDLSLIKYNMKGDFIELEKDVTVYIMCYRNTTVMYQDFL